MATPRKIAGENQTSSSSSSNVPNPEGDQRQAFLKELTSADEYHGEKSFYQHLFNVYSYLKSQSLPDEVCDAGLFHSVYGTEFYHFQSATITRDVVRGYIGEYAEELAHIFYRLRKDRFASIVNNTPRWGVRQHLDLCRLEYANFWDGKEDRNVQDQMEILSQTIARLESRKLG
ncbi:hypothetical protein BDV96DRAFT_592108 [Lophiotrema nucula]|uniref:DUF6817 domain-containing protein n=1 Tax=Lophiotrema nucula TaxID=690887 RepID=A0A6A5YEF9_9PLEO|nr:hypothetical protein BDV96DRAFT_592108 [Lophiotrema nucula]